MTINAENVIHESSSLEDGAIDYWGLGYREYQINLLYKTFRNYGIPYVDNTKVCDFDENQKNMLLYGFDCEAIKQAFPNIIPPKTVTEGRFEGVYTNLWRRLSDNQQLIAASDWVVDLGPEGGIHGGRVIAEGTPIDLINNECSVTGRYLKGYIQV